MWRAERKAEQDAAAEKSAAALLRMGSCLARAADFVL